MSPPFCRQPKSALAAVIVSKQAKKLAAIYANH
jgi:hypothetical protein